MRMPNIGRGPRKMEWFSGRGGAPRVGIRPMVTPAIAIRSFDASAARSLFVSSDSFRETRVGPDGIAVGRVSGPITFRFNLTELGKSGLLYYFPDATDKMLKDLASTGIYVKAETENEAWEKLPGRLDQAVKAFCSRPE